MAPKPSLTIAQIEEIRALKKTNPNLSQEELADRYAVSRATIRQALAAPDTPNSPVTMISLELLIASPLNPRKTFSEESIAEMAASIEAEGLIQNLVVRLPKDDGYMSIQTRSGEKLPGLYEIIAGERRMRALRLLASQGKWTDPVPCVVKEVDDATFLALSLVENLQREDVPPLEEAEAIARLHTADPETYTTHEIARRIGKSVRYVQQRIQVHRDAALPARLAFQHGMMTFEALRLLAAECEAVQMEILSDQELTDIAEEGADIEAIKEAFFEYEATPITADLIKREIGHIRDREAQHKAAAAQAAAPGRESAMRLGNPKAESDGDDGELASDVGEDPADDPDFVPVFSPPPIRPPESVELSAAPFTKSHIQHAHRRKSIAMQLAVVEDTAMAMRLTCLALLGPQETVRIRSTVADLINEDRPGDVAMLDLDINGALAGTKLPQYYGDGKETKLWRHLLTLEGAHLERLFAALVARTVVTHTGYSVALGDPPLAEEIAGALNIPGNEYKHGLAVTQEDLQGLRKNMLHAVANSVNAPGIAASARTQDIIEAIPQALMSREYVLPTMKFGSTKKLETAVAKVLK